LCFYDGSSKKPSYKVSKEDFRNEYQKLQSDLSGVPARLKIWLREKTKLHPQSVKDVADFIDEKFEFSKPHDDG